MPETETCKFVKSWIGQCGSPATDDGYCPEHAALTCVSCGAKATHDCDHTGVLVCGYPLCDDCTHGVPAKGQEGFFLLGGGHYKKTAFHQHTRDCYDDVGPGRGGLLLICDKIEGVDPA